MSENSTNQEIDLDVVFNKFSNTLKATIRKFFRFLNFIKRNLVFLVPLFFLLAYAGYTLDKKFVTYSSQIFIKSNFNNVDYLYSKIESINSKLKTKDLEYLNNHKLTLDGINKIEIAPVEDPFDFVAGKSETTFELLKLFAEENNIDKVVSAEKFYKNYNSHIITLESSEPIDLKKSYTSLLFNLNSNSYYQENMNIVNSNIKDKIKSNKGIISQIDKIITESNNGDKSAKDKIVMVGENNQLSSLLNMKDELIRENQNYNITLLNNTSIFKVISDDIENVIIKTNLFIFILPILGILAYFFIAFLAYLRKYAK